MNNLLSETKVEVQFQSTEGTATGRQTRPRKSSSMVDLKAYSTSPQWEIPDTTSSEVWRRTRTGSSSYEKVEPGYLGMLRSRHESEPINSVPSYAVFRRTKTWLSNTFEAMDQNMDFIDGLSQIPVPGAPFVTPYDPVKVHWFFCRKEKDKEVWVPFSFYDSRRLEEGHLQYKNGNQQFAIIQTQGGRYDVSLRDRKLHAAYWEDDPVGVRRGSWFWKAVGEIWVPYDEVIAEKLEGEYKLCCRTGVWQKRIDLPGGETIALHSEVTMIHYDATRSWTDVAETLYKNQKIVKRDWEGTCLPDEGEWEPIDHLVFVSHGIGSYCDLKWRNLNQCVDAYRLMSHNLLKKHFNFAVKKSRSFRVEFIPINWHNILHSENTELENRIKRITLPSIPIVRYFANDYVLDILFYSSPVYCKVIADHVGEKMNRLHALFLERNPDFHGNVSIIGHSLGSIVLFDMLSHQPDSNMKKHNAMDLGFSTISTELTVEGSLGNQDHIDGSPNINRQESTIAAAYNVPPFMGAGYPSIQYPQLVFRPAIFFAIGSPIGMFLGVRGVSQIDENYALPTCRKFLNIFHPTDPVAYRIEPLIIPEACKVPAAVIDHHKGRQRMHLEVQRNIATVASSLKSRLWDPIRALTSFATRTTTEKVEPDVTVQLPIVEKPRERNTFGPAAPIPSSSQSNGDTPKIKRFGRLNEGGRIDYVLQEAPLESLSQYLFALQSHAVYWDSDDTLLFMLKQIIEVEKDNLYASTLESEEEENQYV